MAPPINEPGAGARARPRTLCLTLRLWHLLSLDAPCVAALWCGAFARAARQSLPGWLPLALALGTWLFYVTDRLLDAQLLEPAMLEERHRFHRRHARWFLATAVPVAMALCALITCMPLSLLRAYVVLGVLSLLYLAVVHLPARAGSRAVRFFPKELAVALLFSAASALPAWDAAQQAAHGMPRHHPLLLLSPLFAALCWLNCLAIEYWERRRAGLRIAAAAAFVALASVGSLPGLATATARMLALCCAGSALLFLALDRSALQAQGRRIAADLVLLTPLLLLARRGGR